MSSEVQALKQIDNKIEQHLSTLQDLQEEKKDVVDNLIMKVPGGGKRKKLTRKKSSGRKRSALKKKRTGRKKSSGKRKAKKSRGSRKRTKRTGRK